MPSGQFWAWLFVMKVMRRSAFDEGHRDPMQEVHVQSAIKHPAEGALWPR